MVGGHGGRRDPVAGEDHDGAAKPVRILVVEDEFLVATSAARALQEAGFEIAGITGSGEEAIRIAARERPALALMDIRLSGVIDGIDAAYAIYRDHGIRSIFATAHYDKKVQARASRAAPLGWLPKPFEMATLVLKVRSALQPH